MVKCPDVEGGWRIMCAHEHCNVCGKIRLKSRLIKGTCPQCREKIFAMWGRRKGGERNVNNKKDSQV